MDDIICYSAHSARSTGGAHLSSNSRGGGSRHVGTNRNNRKSNAISISLETIISVLFAFVLIFGGLVSILDEDPVMSEKENRLLKAYPKFSIRALANGSYLQETEEAYNDTFPMRDTWVEVNAAIKETLTIKHNGEMFIDDGNDEGEETDEDFIALPVNIPVEQPEVEATESFESSQQEEVIEELSEPEEIAVVENPFDPTKEFVFDITGYEDFIDGSAKVSNVVYNGRGIRYVWSNDTFLEYYCQALYSIKCMYPESNLISVLAPSGAAYYGEEQTGNENQQAMMEIIAKNLEGAVICPDVYSVLAEHTDEYIYYRTDHHWTALGSYYAYCEAVKSIGIEPVDIYSLEEHELPGYLGSFSNKSNSVELRRNPDTVFYYLPTVDTTVLCHTNPVNMSSTTEIELVGESNVTKNGSKYAVFMKGDNPLLDVTTNAGTGKTALVIKTSFGDVFTPWLANHYDTIYVVDPRHVNTSTVHPFILNQYFEGIEFDDIYFCFGTNALSHKGSLNGLAKLITGP